MTLNDDRQVALPPVNVRQELKFDRTMNSHQITFGDKVRIRAAAATESRGMAGQREVAHGFTTPSQTGVEVIGDFVGDYTIAVMIEGRSKAMWFAEDLLESVVEMCGTLYFNKEESHDRVL